MQQRLKKKVLYDQVPLGPRYKWRKAVLKSGRDRAGEEVAMRYGNAEGDNYTFDPRRSGAEIPAPSISDPSPQHNQKPVTPPAKD